MVGVAGKSKACHECKRRRVKCDFTRPGCLRCVKAGKLCPGYERSALFVNRTLEEPSMSAATALFREQAKQQRSNQRLVDELCDVVQESRAEGEDPTRFRTRAFRLIKRIYLPMPEDLDDDPSRSVLFGWIRAVCELCQPNAVLDSALLALCTTFVHIEDPSAVPLERAIDSYREALLRLGSQAPQELYAQLEYTLASIALISTSEIFVCDNDDGWRVHVQGILEALRLRIARGLSLVPVDIWNRLCLRLRIVIVLGSLAKCNDILPTHTQWLELMPNYSSADALDCLQDITCELPNHIREFRSTRDECDALGQIHKASMARMIDVLVGLHQWQSNLLEQTGRPLYTARPAHLNNPSDAAYGSRLFPFALMFDSWRIATPLVLSWAMQLQIYAEFLQCPKRRDWSMQEISLWSMGRATTEKNTLPETHLSLSDGHMKIEADKLMRLLCQSVEYCHRPEMGIFGPQTMVYARWIMCKYLQHENMHRELAWWKDVPNMTGTPTRCNIRIMKFEEAAEVDRDYSQELRRQRANDADSMTDEATPEGNGHQVPQSPFSATSQQLNVVAMCRTL